MNVSSHLHLVPEIEKRIVDNRLDSVVMGMGPTAWLMPYVSRKILNDVRLWGVHDGCRIMPVDDLVIMDTPINALHPDTTRHRHIVEARPKRAWVYYRAYDHWIKLLHSSMHDVTESVTWAVWNPDGLPPDPRFKLVPPDGKDLHTLAISPTGTTTLAWREGCRRIGVIGVDMMKNHHHTYKWGAGVGRFFARCCQHAHERGGWLQNLSPITSLTEFAQWTPSESSSEQTDTSKKEEPNSSSSTQSASSASDKTLKSPGCEAAKASLPSAKTATQGHGGSETL